MKDISGQELIAAAQRQQGGVSVSLVAGRVDPPKTADASHGWASHSICGRNQKQLLYLRKGA